MPSISTEIPSRSSIRLRGDLPCGRADGQTIRMDAAVAGQRRTAGCLKGRSAQEEIVKATKEISKNGGFHPRVVEAEVGPGLEPTHVLMVDKR